MYNLILFLASEENPYELYGNEKHHPIVPEPALTGFLILAVILILFFLARRKK